MIAACATLLLLMAAGQGPARLAHPEVDFKGKLYRAVFVAGPDVLSSGDIAMVPEPLRARLGRFLTKRSEFTTQYQGTATDVDGVARDARRRAIERAIVASVDAPDARSLAVAFVKDAPIAYDWEKQPEGPLAEAAYAESVLQKNPSTPLAPFIDLFIAQRQRAAAEAAEYKKDAAAATAAMTQYQSYLQKARASSDPLFGLIADDLERTPFVYVRKQ